MNKADLVAKIADDAEITRTQAEKVLSTVIAETIAALKAGDKVTLVGFGTFSAVARAARTGRNPQTGATIKIAAKTNGKFTPGKDLKDLHGPAVVVAKALAAEKAKTATKPTKASAKKK